MIIQMKKAKRLIAVVLCIFLISSVTPYVQADTTSLSLTFTDYEPIITEVINEKSGLTHPSIGVTKDELENVRTQIKNGVDPWSSYLVGMLKTKYASKSYSIRNQSSTDPSKANYSYANYTSGFMESIIQEDAKAAYIQAILYYFTGDEEYRRKSITTLRLWSQLDPNEATYVVDGKIKMSAPMYYMVSAAEIIKYTSCQSEDLIWTEEDDSNFINNFVRPPLRLYLASDESVDYWMNQYNYSVLARIAADIFMDDIEDYNIAVEMATVNKRASNAGGNGSLSRVIRRLNDDGNVEGLEDDVVQLAEMGRDQPHASGNLYCLSNIAYMLEGQGTKVDPETGEVSTASNAVSMFNFLDNRLLRGVNYYLKYNMGYETMWYPVATDAKMEDGKITNITSTYDVLYDQGRGRFYNFSLLYYYYKYNSFTKDLMDDDKVGQYLTEIQSLIPAPESGDYSSSEGFDYWLHIPIEEANISAQGKGSSNSYEVENRYNLLRGIATKESDEDVSYVKLIADEKGTDIALLNVPTSRDRSGYSVITLRVKTNSNSKLELRRDNNSNPFTTVNLPNTNGEWTDIVINMNVDEVSYSEYSQDIQILFATVVGEVDNYVAIDNLRVNETDNYAPKFENSVTEKIISTYVGADLSTSFEASDKNNDILTYKCINEPENSTIDTSNGNFTWSPDKEGIYTFFVQVTDNKATSILEVTVNVTSDIKEVVSKIIESYDSNESYISISKLAFDNAYNKVEELIGKNESDKEVINNALKDLQEAVDRLELLTPLLSDGTINYSNMVISSLSESKEKNLLDNDTETFTGDLFRPNNYFDFDFGKDYSVTADAFKIQSRKYFSGRIWGATIYGSDDGENWIRITNAKVGDTAGMVELPVIEEYRNTSFRYLRIGSDVACFNPSEFRIVGKRNETTNRITDVSIVSSNVNSKRALPGDTVTLTFKAKDKISNINATIDGKQAKITELGGLTYKAEITVDNENATIGDVKFKITYDTSNSEEGMPAEEVTDDSSVFLSEETNVIDIMDESVDFIDSTNRYSIDTRTQVSYLFDNKDTCSDFRLNGSGWGAYIIFDFKENPVNLSRIEVLPRQDQYCTRIEGLTILVSNDGEEWTKATEDTVSKMKKWQLLNIDDNNYYRYIKITNPNNWYGNIAELRLIGDR